jgi:hypothetical protein
MLSFCAYDVVITRSNCVKILGPEKEHGARLVSVYDDSMRVGEMTKTLASVGITKGHPG